MSDETKAVEQTYQYQVDQQVSINGYFDVDINGENVKFQITNRYGATPEKIAKTVKASIDAFALLRQEFPRTLVRAVTETRTPIDDSGNELPAVNSYVATKLSVSLNDGKFSYRVHGGQFEKWGIAVYDEVLKAANITIDHAHPEAAPNIAGWRVDWIEYDGKEPGKKFKKVTRLLPNKAPF